MTKLTNKNMKNTSKKSKYTRKERYNLYGKVLERIESSKNSFICSALSNTIDPLKINFSKTLRFDFPELYNRKPKNKSVGQMWFPHNEKGRQARIKLLKQLRREVR